MSYFSDNTISKAESPDNGDYTIYKPTGQWDLPSGDYLQAISVDPGRKNFAIRVERRYFNGKIISLFFDKFCIEDIQVTRVGGTDKKPKNLTTYNTFNRLNEVLDQCEPYLNDTHMVVIERQLAKNYKATRVAQHTISYFLLAMRQCSHNPAILELSPRIKGKVLEFSGSGDRDLKIWATHTAIDLLTMRKDKASLDMINYHRKKDDLADTICQLEALCILMGYPATIEYKTTIFVIQ